MQIVVLATDNIASEPLGAFDSMMDAINSVKFSYHNHPDKNQMTIERINYNYYIIKCPEDKIITLRGIPLYKEVVHL